MIKYISTVLTFVCLSASLTFAQTIDFAVEAVDFLADVKIEVVDFLADEKWEVLGACNNRPNLRVEFVDFLADVKVEIVDFLADRKICITNAESLDENLLRKLHLID